MIACDTYEVQVAAPGFLNAQRLRGLIRLMRYSGLRIGDAVNLSTDRITDDKLFPYTQKTSTAVNTVLPPFVVKELAATPRVTDKLYFWSGNGELETAVKDWQAKIRTLFDLAGVDKGENFTTTRPGFTEEGYDTNDDTNAQSDTDSKPQVVEINGRPVGTRTPDLYRVKAA